MEGMYVELGPEAASMCVIPSIGGLGTLLKGKRLENRSNRGVKTTCSVLLMQNQQLITKSCYRFYNCHEMNIWKVL